jgi:transcription antitermination factor NusG
MTLKPTLPLIPSNPHQWYAIYTRARAEKKVFQFLLEDGVEAYMPLIKTLRQWSDRKKWVEEPLFRSYVFVFISQKRYYDVLNVDGVVRFVTFEGKAVAIPPQQIEAIRSFVSEGEEMIANMDKYRIGQEVVVIQGPMKGLEGTLVRIYGRQKVRVEISGIGQVVFVKIPVSLLRVVQN